ncbi:hypothetical protein D3C84_511760 [compost metagenome]
MCRQLQTRAQRAEPLHLVHNEGIGNAFDLGGPQSLEFEITLRQLVGGLAHQDRRGCGDSLHPGRNVDRVPDRIVIGVQIVRADRTHDDLSGMDADADLQRNAFLQANAVAMSAYRLLHAQCRIQRPLRMILMGDGGAEQREDAIAQRLGHVAFVVVDGFHHQRDDGLDQALGLFRIEVMDQRRGTGHVGKKCRDGFTLTGGLTTGFHSCLFGADALGKVVGRVMNGCWRRP